MMKKDDCVTITIRSFAKAEIKYMSVYGYPTNPKSFCPPKGFFF